MAPLHLWDQDLGRSYSFFRRDYYDEYTGVIVRQELWSHGMGNGVQERQWDLKALDERGELVPLEEQKHGY